MEIPIKIVWLFLLVGWSILMIRNSITWLFNAKHKFKFNEFIAQSIVYTLWIIAWIYYFKYGVL